MIRLAAHLLPVALMLAVPLLPATAGTRIETLCRIKGHEENTLHNMGLVVGLKGTGDGKLNPMHRTLATTMERMGIPVTAEELKDAKNVALVYVTATVPAAGARQGDMIDCVVSAVGSCADLTGGRLVSTPLLGPVPSPDAPVFALAQGDVTTENPDVLTKGKIRAGCRLEQEFRYNYVKDGKVMLVLKPQYAEFGVAQEVAEMINGPQILYQNNSRLVAQALDAVTIEVEIPGQYLADPVHFVTQLMQLEMTTVPVGPRVVINERAGIIGFRGDVQISPVAVSHRNIVVETGTAAQNGSFVPVDPTDPQNPPLKSLVASLNAINVPTADIIEIIKLLDANGAIAGDVIFQ
ncbi:MAG: flagellar basal body P-ring protein FlgI [Thermoguttaceae bacterium]